MKNYLEMCQFVLEHGMKKDDRTQTGTISYFGYQLRCNLEDGFPLLTTKKVYYKAVLGELLWFISGSTNIAPLVKQGIRIWNEWPYAIYQQKGYQDSIEEFIEKIKNDEEFAKLHGELGPVYGHQWRNFNGVDQLKELEHNLKHHPFSRRHIISAWNPSDIDKMALPPCHCFVQFYVSGDKKKLSCQLYQRSADIFLGVPFNIASYATLLLMLCHTCNYEPGDFVHTFGDAHIYLNHLDQINLQLKRTPRSLPRLLIKRKVDSIFDFKYEDFEVVDYHPYPPIKGEVSV